MLQDLRFAVRQMQKNPGFSLVAILTLALAVGANTAIFSAIDALILHPLPYRHPEQLVTLNETLKKFNLIKIPVSAQEFHDLRDMSKSFSQVGADAPGAFTLTGRGAAEAIPGVQISASVFAMLDVKPIAGGLFTQDEEQYGKHRVVVISERFWKQRFAADPAIAGKSIELNRESYRVLGVIHPILQYRGGSWDLFVPLSFQPSEMAPPMRNRKYLDILARMKPGVSLTQAASDLTSIAGRLSTQYPAAYPRDFGFSLDAESLAGRIAGDLRTPLLVLIGAVGALMLIACANVSSLLLARAIARRREMTIRTALGAGRGRVIRQLLSESVALAAVAAAIGLAIAAGVLKLYEVYGPGDLIRVSGLSMNVWVAAFAIGISAAASILFGVAPALEAARVDLSEALKETTRGASGRRRRLREVLVAGEVAASLVLLAGAGLLVRSLVRLQETSPGFRAENVLTFQLVLPAAQYRDESRRSAVFDAVLDRLRAIPGVLSAGAIDPLPFTGGNNGSSIGIVGRHENPGDPQPIAGTRRTAPGYFESMGIPLIRGRRFTAADAKSAPLVAIIDEGVVRRYFPNNEDPVGHQLTGVTDGPATIVGVVGAIKQLDLAAPAQMAVYYPANQLSGFTLTVAMKTAGDPLAMLPAARREVAAIDPNLPISRSATMEQRLSDSLARRRISVQLMTLFAVLAGVLAAIGIYGVLSYLVDQRRRELAIRMALGARSGQVIRLVAAQGAWPVVVGVLAGLAGAFGATRLLKTLLYEVNATDPAVFGGVTAVLIVVALAAIAIPAGRATRVDPVVALRDE